jgi:hypothetical protein
LVGTFEGCERSQALPVSVLAVCIYLETMRNDTKSIKL